MKQTGLMPSFDYHTAVFFRCFNAVRPSKQQGHDPLGAGLCQSGRALAYVKALRRTRTVDLHLLPHSVPATSIFLCSGSFFFFDRLHRSTSHGRRSPSHSSRPIALDTAGLSGAGEIVELAEPAKGDDKESLAELLRENPAVFARPVEPPTPDINTTVGEKASRLGAWDSGGGSNIASPSGARVAAGQAVGRGSRVSRPRSSACQSCCGDQKERARLRGGTHGPRTTIKWSGVVGGAHARVHSWLGHRASIALEGDDIVHISLFRVRAQDYARPS